MLKVPRTIHTDRVVRTAAWFYLAPRVIIVALVVAVLGLAAFLVLTPLLRTWLQRLGA